MDFLKFKLAYIGRELIYCHLFLYSLIIVFEISLDLFFNECDFKYPVSLHLFAF